LASAASKRRGDVREAVVRAMTRKRRKRVERKGVVERAMAGEG